MRKTRVKKDLLGRLISVEPSVYKISGRDDQVRTTNRGEKVVHLMFLFTIVFSWGKACRRL